MPTPFAAVAALCEALAATTKRLEKRRLLAGFLRSLEPEEVSPAVLFLTGKIFPESEQKGLNVGWATLSKALDGPRQRTLEAAPLTILSVKESLNKIAATSGKDSVARKRRLLETLLGGIPDGERKWLLGSLFGELRIGAVEGVMLEAIADAAGVSAGVVRNANLLAGDLGAVAHAALTGGEPALAAFSLRLFTPLKPMLADTPEDWEDVLEEHGGRTAVEFKLDGARIQIHRRGDEVRIFSRRLTEVTASLPEVVEMAGGLPATSLLLEGEVIAVDVVGKPLPFQDLMRRFRRVHNIEAVRGEVPLRLFLFDLLHRDGRTMLSIPYEDRWRELASLVPAEFLPPRRVVTTVAEIDAFFREALAAGHEGLMAKALDSDYTLGKRGKKWCKIKPAETLDCAIIAAEWGHGRRKGTLSNYHLAVRDGDAWQMIGKTFKGLTDAERQSMTERLLAFRSDDHRWWVGVRPEVVVEVAYDEVQKSPNYPSGFALRFARIARVRDDKGPAEATTYAELRKRYEAQFAAKGRLEL